jgi:cellobiose phosphorylase
VIRHGFGYTVFEHTEDGIASELWVYVAVDAPVKFSVLTCRNVSGRPRRLSVTGYCEWVLADQRRNSLLHVRTELDPDTGALLARNPYHTDFAERIAFIDLQEPSTTITGDRTEFIGRNGRLSHPAAMLRSRLSGKVGAGLDPCGAVQVSFDLPAGGVKETRLRIGVGRSRGEVHTLIRRFRGTGSARSALEAVWEYWNRTLGAINVDTPDASVNVMTNGWLLYQTLSCRMWGRSGFYQSGGAYGFRDQLQDSMALVHAEPALVREHLLRAAGRQFREGDVQHWWHPPAGRGVRTHFSDDYLWLPYVTCHYVTSVGDSGVLDAKAGFIESRKLRPEEESLYELPNHSEESASLYQHCVLAIENGLRFGPNGLPLIGCGDWNDGMNQVGPEGRGESVWLGFFLFDVLQRFAVLADGYGDQPFAERCRSSAAQLQLNIESHAWDGDWYRRAYFDNGVALGSTSSPECQIDSLPQSWAVLSGAGDAQRAHTAMESVQQRLIHHDTQLVQLFTPPFDKGGLNPGYIKGYIPGVRENGGQYTHAAIWVAMAFARMGDYKRAWEVFHLINPINHAATAEGIERYKAEPYVVAADVYAVEPHMGRGGWSWYTGSAAWMYRLLSETLLGIHREGDHLRLQPCPPPTWDSYKIHYRYYATVYHITLRRSTDDAAQATLMVDGVGMPGNRFLMHNDQQEHGVEFRFQ